MIPHSSVEECQFAEYSKYVITVIQQLVLKWLLKAQVPMHVLPSPTTDLFSPHSKQVTSPAYSSKGSSTVVVFSW